MEGRERERDGGRVGRYGVWVVWWWLEAGGSQEGLNYFLSQKRDLLTDCQWSPHYLGVIVLTFQDETGADSERDEVHQDRGGGGEGG